ncbi:MAG TPA: tetratricopeptide repeat protein [Verrucomicrobiae bacterium]|nr:tetratricopeptide repeat protein [Verrucomicrobiae bacterium]
MAKNRWARDAGVIVLATLAVYLPLAHGGFLWDDAEYLANNPLVTGSGGLWRIWFSTQPKDYYPLTYTVWWLMWRAFGARPTAYLTLNVLLHAANAVLIWRVLRRWQAPGAWFAALWFAVHPVNVATVAWVSELKNLLAMLFAALTVLWYSRFEEERRGRWYAAALMAFALALLSKTAVVMLPVVLLGMTCWRAGRWEWRAAWRVVPFAALSVGLGLVTIWFQHQRVLEGMPAQNVNFAMRVTTAAWAFWFYLWKAVWPVNLTLIYPAWNVGAGSLAAWLPVFACAIVVVLLWQGRRLQWIRECVAGVGYFAVMLLPVLGFVDQGFYAYSPVADHWQYPALPGVLALGSALGTTALAAVPSFRRVAGVALLIGLGWLNWQRAAVYANGIELWRDALRRNPDAWAAHYNLGIQLSLDGKTDEAITQYRQALRLHPDYPEAHNNLGNALSRQGDLDGARRELMEAVRLKPNFAAAHNNLGIVFGQQGDLGAAIEQFRESLRDEPGFADAQYNLALAFEKQGRLPEAIACYRDALTARPDEVDWLTKLAWLRATSSQPTARDGAEAARLAIRACELTKHQQPAPLDALAAAYAETGRWDEAVQTASEAAAVARELNLPAVAQLIESRRQIYARHQAYHERQEAK